MTSQHIIISLCTARPHCESRSRFALTVMELPLHAGNRFNARPKRKFVGRLYAVDQPCRAQPSEGMNKMDAKQA